MENIELYKEFYFFEINRKHELNKEINIPVLVLTIIVSINLFLFKQTMESLILLIGELLSIITFFGLLYALYYLISSFSNFINNHNYREIADMKTVYNYELKNKDNENEFNNYLKEEFANCSSHNFNINKKRTENIAKSKRGIFFCLISTFLFSLVYIISIL